MELIISKPELVFFAFLTFISIIGSLILPIMLIFLVIIIIYYQNNLDIYFLNFVVNIHLKY